MAHAEDDDAEDAGHGRLQSGCSAGAADPLEAAGSQACAPRTAGARPAPSAGRVAASVCASAGQRSRRRASAKRPLSDLAASLRRPESLQTGQRMSGVNEIRSTFLDYFRKNGHEVVPSSPLVPRNDPTLMFTNAGMVQFKNVFTGAREAALLARHHRAEMRARRRQAQRPRQCRLHRAPPHLLRDARQFLLRRLFQGATRSSSPGSWSPRSSASPKDRLLVTVYSRGRRGVRPLEEDRRPARATASSASPTSDNFWAMGDTGPCGPCSEIFYDHGDADPGRPARLAR